MTPTKLLVGQILVVLAIMVLGVWAATQWAAAMLGYQPRLGPAWFEAAGVPGLSAVGAVRLVNYRLRGRYYVVDRLFAAAELRLGERRQQVVRIVRLPAGRRGGGR